MDVTPEQIAWAAGLFEGEGSISLAYKLSGPARTRLGYGRMVVAMTDRDVVERFHKVMGCGTVRTAKRPPHKDIHIWSTTSRASFVKVSEALGPWLGARRRERLEAVIAASSPVRRRPPKRQLCRRGHWLHGDNAKPNGLAANGLPKIACRKCINEAQRARYARRTRDDKSALDCTWS
ncbi:MAG TPA: hypothetical protein VGJ60_07260 [Chloroflexota bacterium]